MLWFCSCRLGGFADTPASAAGSAAQIETDHSRQTQRESLLIERRSRSEGSLSSLFDEGGVTELRPSVDISSWHLPHQWTDAIDEVNSLRSFSAGGAPFPSSASSSSPHLTPLRELPTQTPSNPSDTRISSRPQTSIDAAIQFINARRQTPQTPLSALLSTRP